MTGFSNGDSDNLERIATALERSAIAEERRNELIELGEAARQQAWTESQERERTVLEAIVGQPTSPPVDELMSIVLRTANMGSCSQTHHEHLAAAASQLLVKINEPRP